MREELKVSPPEGSPNPTLCFTFGYSARTFEGKLVERYEGGNVVLGWYSNETVAANDRLITIDFCGFNVVISLESLKMLKGKKLLLRTVEVGVPNPSDVKKQMLIVE